MSQLSFGKYSGRDIDEIPDSYLKWLVEKTDWFEKQYPEFVAEIESELEYRERWNKHIYEDRGYER